MKYVVVFAVLAIAYVLWRNARVDGKAQDSRRAQAREDAKPQDMVSCPVCSVHLPRGEALPGADGRLYCSQEHRLKSGS